MDTCGKSLREATYDGTSALQSDANSRLLRCVRGGDDGGRLLDETVQRQTVVPNYGLVFSKLVGE